MLKTGTILYLKEYYRLQVPLVLKKLEMLRSFQKTQFMVATFTDKGQEMSSLSKFKYYFHCCRTPHCPAVKRL